MGKEGKAERGQKKRKWEKTALEVEEQQALEPVMANNSKESDKKTEIVAVVIACLNPRHVSVPVTWSPVRNY